MPSKYCTLTLHARDQAVQRENLVHLDSSNERTASLTDDVRD